MQARSYIQNFQMFQNTQNDSFATRVTEMLNAYVNASWQYKSFVDQKRKVDEELDQCNKDRQMDIFSSRANAPSH